MPDIHATAVVSPDAKLGSGVEVGPHAVIEAGTVIGEGSRIMAGAYICTRTTLGAENEVHMHAVLGHVPQDTHFEGGETFLEIGDRNVIREMATVHRGTQEGSATRIGSGARSAPFCLMPRRLLMNGASRRMNGIRMRMMDCRLTLKKRRLNLRTRSKERIS